MLARHNGFVDNASLRQVTGRHLVDITRVLGHLRDRELLEMIGAKRGARYELTDWLVEHAGAADTEDLAADTEDLSHDPAPEIPDDRARLEHLAEVVARTGKIDATTRDEIIVEMCAIRPMAIEELAALLDRSVPHMRAILRPLIRQGRLQYLYPDRPRSRQQRYTVPEGSGLP